MQSPDTAPKDRRFLALIKTYAYDRTAGRQLPMGHKIVECFWRAKTDSFRIWLGREGYTTTEPCDIVGWWERPDDENDKVVNLASIPDGWWLHGLHHNHTSPKYQGEVYVPFDESGHGDPWTCKLQRREGGLLTEGTGPTAQAALDAAVTEVELRYMKPSE